MNAPGELVYPLRRVIEAVAITLDVDYDRSDYPALGSPEHLAQIRDTVLSNLDGKSVSERDALLLARLNFRTLGTASWEACLFDFYEACLNRNGLREKAAAFADANAVFAANRASPDERARQYQGDKALQAKLKAASTRFVAAPEELLELAERLIEGDPSYSDYRAKLEAVEDWEKMRFLLGKIREWEHSGTPLPEPLRHFSALDTLILECTNGGFHQYLSNSSGNDALHMRAALRALGLSQQVADAESAMSLLGAPYPTDRAERSARFQTLSADQHDALNEPTWIVDDEGLYSAMIDAAKRSGCFPR